jgi:hypothetical protein
MADDDFFAMPPAEEPADAPGGDFTMLGDAPPAEDPEMLGDVNETPDMGFAGGGDFAAPSEEEETPIILGPPAVEEPEIPVVEEEEEEPMPAINPSIMAKWNEEWQVTLSQRKDEENSKKAEMVEASRASLEKFQADREAKRESKMATNREDEQAKLEAIEADLENDNSWQRVCKMVELSHDGAHEGEDVKRMRDVLILLKNEPARASAVGA